MTKSKHKLGRVMRRDGGVCGKHLGGCGRELTTRREATLDHIIPQAYFTAMTSLKARDFGRDWNLQPTCSKCNERKKGQMNGWPLFQCGCHFLQIDPSGCMWVHELTGPKEGRHLLRPDCVSDGNAVVFTANLGRRQWTDKDGTTWRGYSHGDNGQFGETGHMMACIPRSNIEPFNWFEQVRVGRARTNLGLRSDGRFCTFRLNGKILGGGGHWCAESFDRSRGFENIYYDPFTPARLSP